MLLMLLMCLFSSLSFASQAEGVQETKVDVQKKLTFKVELYTKQSVDGCQQILMRRLKAIDSNGIHVGKAEMPANNPCRLGNLIVKK